jgi:hypothetical protein
MRSESELRALLRAMHPEMDATDYVFISADPDRPPMLPSAPILTFREEEGLTQIVRRDEASRAGLVSAFPCRRITLTVRSNLAAVGFLAALCSELAKAGISVNAVSAFHHDHLFVPIDEAERALSVLKELAARSVA